MSSTGVTSRFSWPTFIRQDLSGKDTPAQLTFLANFDGASRHYRQEWFHYAARADRHSRRSLRASVLPRLDRRWSHRLAQHRPRILSGLRRRWLKRNRRASAFKSTRRWRRSSFRSTRIGSATNCPIFYASGDHNPTRLDGDRVRHCPGSAILHRRSVQFFLSPRFQSWLARR